MLEIDVRNALESDSSMVESRSLMVMAMVEKQSEIGRDAQLAMLLRYKWREEIEQAISRVKKSLTRFEADKWFRKQWYRALAVSKRCEHGIAKQNDDRLHITRTEFWGRTINGSAIKSSDAAFPEPR